MVDIFPLRDGTLDAQIGMLRTRQESNYYQIPAARDGLDAVFFVTKMNAQLAQLEDNMIEIMGNANLSDTQRQFDLQINMNTWSAISQGMTNLLKAVSDVNKAIVRNIE